MTCTCATTPCGCTPVFPQPACNASGLPAIACRIGDFSAFREQLLTPLAGETELTAWRPNAAGDLAVQMMEWWAYLADILTFYNERIANEAYLRTAILPESVNHLVQTLGYRPKPALGAKGTLAALLSPNPRLPVGVPAGLQVQNKPGPGQSPQTFQVDQQTAITAPDVISAVVVPAQSWLLGQGFVWLAGKVSSIKAADRLLLVNASVLTTQSLSDWQWISVTVVSAQSDPLGNAVTQVAFTALSGSIVPGAQAASYVLLRPGQSSPLWGYATANASVVAQPNPTTLQIALAGTARNLTSGSLVLLDIGDGVAGAGALATAFAGAFQNAPFLAAYNAADTGGGWGGLGFALSYPMLVATAFAAAYLSTPLANGRATDAFSYAMAFAAPYAKAFDTGFATSVAAAFVQAYKGPVDAAAGQSAVSTALATIPAGLPALARPLATAFAAGFAAAGARLPGTFVATTAAFAMAFNTVFDAAFEQYIANPASAASAAIAAVTELLPTPAIVAAYSESIWYANGDGPTAPAAQTPPVTAMGIPSGQIFVSAIDTTGTAATLWNGNAAQATLRFGFTAVGQLVPVLTEADLTWSGGATPFVPAPGQPAFPSLPADALFEDINGNAVSGTLQAVGNGAASLTTSMANPPSLASPVSVFFNLVGVSRGKTVVSETLGSGNPTVAGQDFTLQNTPVTYFFDPASLSGPNFSSTVQVSVNGVLWQEVTSFYGQSPNAQVFLLHEDDAGSTHVSFGDGVNGALLPTGANNIVASYRTGAGYAAPAPETLTVVMTPAAGLKGLRNPLPPIGGGDPDQPAELRLLAPRSVLTFNRAVSLDDYAAIAMTASGTTQAVALYAFDPLSQRPVVMLYVAGDSGAVATAGAALAATAVPSQGLRIVPATQLIATLSLTYLRDPRYADAAVQAAITTALLDPDSGLLGANLLGIGQPVYHSQIAAACLAVPGVTAIQDVTLATAGLGRFRYEWYSPGKANPDPGLQPLGCDGQGWSPGAGQIIVLPNDGQHLVLTGLAAS